jgi:hypothetical protein
MMVRSILFAAALVGACAFPNIPGFGGGGGGTTTAQKTETHSSSQTEEMHVNGKPVALDKADDEDEAPRSSAKPKSTKADIGKTCHHNNECAADACYVGYGDLGYCTKICDSWSDCPTHWDCKRARNAPQRICMQDAD